MARAAQVEKVSFGKRLKQIGMVLSFTAKNDRLFVPLAVAAALVPLAAGGVAFALGAGWYWLPLSVMVALLGVLIVLNLRSRSAMMRSIEGQQGAAAGIVQNMRGDWRVLPAVSSTTGYDMVHLVIGRSGIVLLGEGNPQRVRALIAQEKRRLAKVLDGVEIRDFVVGNGEGELSLRKLQMTLLRLPRTITGKEVNALETRLKGLTSRQQMPKGAIPKNMRPPKGAYRAMRGR